MDVAGKVVLVTGASSGIGRATAQLLTRRGAQVAIGAPSREGLEDTAKAVRGEGHEMFVAPADISDDASVQAMMAGVVGRFGRLDILVNNAGISGVCLVETTPIPAYRQLVETNLFGTLRVIQAALPTLRAQGGGVILNVSSMTTKETYVGVGAYASTKWAINGLTEALRVELAADNIRVLLAYPGNTATQFAANGPLFVPPDREIAGGAEVKPADSPEFVAANIVRAIETEVAERYMEAVSETSGLTPD